MIPHADCRLVPRRLQLQLQLCTPKFAWWLVFLLILLFVLWPLAALRIGVLFLVFVLLSRNLVILVSRSYQLLLLIEPRCAVQFLLFIEPCCAKLVLLVVLLGAF
jgi:hypothetical protein